LEKADLEDQEEYGDVKTDDKLSRLRIDHGEGYDPLLERYEDGTMYNAELR
jgi:hypothetical protein